MCIAIFKPKGVDISEETLKACWENNPDGAGYAYVGRGRLIVRKGLMNYESFIASWRDRVARYGKTSPFILHFRIRTHGTGDEINTHPFRIKDGALIHNGTISGTGASSAGVGESDTSLFAKMFYDKLTPEFLRDNLKQFGSAIGYNKMVFLFRNGEHYIANEDVGSWSDGVWFSNSGYRTFDERWGGRSACAIGS